MSPQVMQSMASVLFACASSAVIDAIVINRKEKCKKNIDEEIRKTWGQVSSVNEKKEIRKYRKKKMMLNTVISILLSILAVLGIVALYIGIYIYLQHRKAVAIRDWLDFSIDFFDVNSLQIVIFLAVQCANILFLILFSTGAVIKKVGFRVTVSIAAITAIAALLWNYFIPREVPNPIPPNVLASSHNTIPIDFLMEDNMGYFSSMEYEIPHPFTVPSVEDASISTGNTTPTYPSAPEPLPYSSAFSEKVDNEVLEGSVEESLPESVEDTPLSFVELIAEVQNEKNDYEERYHYLLDALNMFESGSVNSKEDSWSIAVMYERLGFYTLDKQKSREYYLKAADMFATEDSYWYVGNIYHDIGEYDESIKAYRRAYGKNSPYDMEDRFYCFTQVIMIYMDILDDYEAAIKECHDAINSFKKDTQICIDIYNLSGGIYREKYAESNDSLLFDKAIAEYRSISGLKNLDSNFSSQIYTSIIDAYMSIDHYDEALMAVNEALDHKTIKADELESSNFIKRRGDIYRKLELTVEAYADYLATNANSQIKSMLIELYSKKEYRAVCALFATGAAEDFNYSVDMYLLYMQAIINVGELSTEADEIMASCLERFDYHPKLLLYCAAFSIHRGNRYVAQDALQKVDHIFFYQQNFLNDNDIINYIKLLIYFGRYEDALKAITSCEGEFTKESAAHIELMSAISIYFYKSLNASLTTRDREEILSHAKNSKAAFDIYGLTNSSLSASFIEVLVSESIDYDLLDAIIEKTIPSNMYLFALRTYRIDKDYRPAIELCTNLIASDPSQFVGFSVYDVYILRAEICREFAKSDELKYDEMIDYLRRSEMDYQFILSEIGYLYEQAIYGLQETSELLAQAIPISM